MKTGRSNDGREKNEQEGSSATVVVLLYDDRLSQRERER